MKTYALGLLSGFFLFSSSLLASEFFNVGLRVDLKYASFGEACRLHALSRHYNLSAELVDGQVKRAQLQSVSTRAPSTVRALSLNELQYLDIRSEQNISWVKSLSFSPEILRVLYQTGHSLSKDDCRPPLDLVIDIGSETQFDFQVEEVGYLLPHLIHSKPVIIRGHKANGEPFKMELTLTQDRT
jgi:hypothetical protein